MTRNFLLLSIASLSIVTLSCNFSLSNSGVNSVVPVAVVAGGPEGLGVVLGESAFLVLALGF